MFKIEYKILKDCNFENQNIHEEDLRYNQILGDIILHYKENLILIDWGWIPLVDFGLCFSNILIRLEEGHTQQFFDFTESDDKIIINRNGELLLLSFSFCEDKIEILISEFKNALINFNESILAYINEHCLSLNQSDFFLEYQNILTFGNISK